MAVEFGPIVSKPIEGLSSPRLSRSATPEGFAVALRTIDVPTPQAMTVLFTPDTPRLGANLTRKIEWATDQQAFTIRRNKRAAIVDEAELKRLMDSPQTGSIIINLNGVSKLSKIDDGVVLFKKQFLPTFTRGDFLPVSSLIVGPVGPTGYTLTYDNPEMKIYLPYEEDRTRRAALTGWFEQLQNHNSVKEVV